MNLQGKMIVLGVSGGIAAYKACTICSSLVQKGADVRVIMTESATRFVQPLTFQTLSRNHVYIDTFKEVDPALVSHIDLADHADLFLVAPATANIIGKLANGLADDMLSTTLLATEAPVWMAPAMNGHMLAHPAVEKNIQTLQSRGVRMIQSGEGLLACGYAGKGRLAEPEQVVAQVEDYFLSRPVLHPQENDFKSIKEPASGSRSSPGTVRTGKWWEGKNLLVTAGPTQEPIDPVRYLSNYSSGKMGYALAEAGLALGANVTLISGPVSLPAPDGVNLVRVKTTHDMYEQVMQVFKEADVTIKAAAVSDYQPVEVASQKIKKKNESYQLDLKKTIDILYELGQKKKDQLLVGFAAETEHAEKYALQKIRNKNLDYIVVNDVTKAGSGFGTDTNQVTIYDRFGHKTELPLLSKQDVAIQILETVADRHE